EARLRHPQVEFRHGDWTCLCEREQFDIVVAFEVIEHVLHPSQFFERASMHVTPGGMLMLSTPNRACAERLAPDRWLGFNISFEHLYFFTATTLAGYAGRNGFLEGPWFSGGGRGEVPDEASAVKTRLMRRVPLRRALVRLRDELRART